MPRSTKVCVSGAWQNRQAFVVADFEASVVNVELNSYLLRSRIQLLRHDAGGLMNQAKRRINFAVLLQNLDVAEADVAVGGDVIGSHLPVAIGLVELFSALARGPLRDPVWEHPVDLRTTDAITA